MDESTRHGHRARPLHGVRLRQAERWVYRGDECTWDRVHVLRVFPAGRRRRGPSYAGLRVGRAPRTAPKRCWWSKTRTRFARSCRRASWRWGTRVVAASNGAEALRLVRDDVPLAALLTDVVMPGMNGPELQQRLRARYPGLQTVFMSGYTDDPHRNRMGWWEMNRRCCGNRLPPMRPLDASGRCWTARERHLRVPGSEGPPCRKPGRRSHPSECECLTRSSGCLASTILRNPSFHFTVVFPTSSCILVVSIPTLCSMFSSRTILRSNPVSSLK